MTVILASLPWYTIPGQVARWYCGTVGCVRLIVRRRNRRTVQYGYLRIRFAVTLSTIY